jgi:hypothetical protein
MKGTKIDIEAVAKEAWDGGVRPEHLTADPSGWREFFIREVGKDIFNEVFKQMTGVPYAGP